ncbi:MAG: alpha/beta hydrolase [Cyanobacteria bacterium P01_H01_bin.121]
MTTLEAITQAPQSGQKPTAQIVILHGWGANARDLVALAPALGLSDYQLVFPNATFPHPQVPGGRMWYDLQHPDWQGLDESRTTLKQWLLDLATQTEIPLEQTILAGFSQGGAMTLDIGLQLPVKALVIFSGYLHPGLTVTRETLPPIAVIHGTQDQVVPIEAAQKTQQFLENQGANFEYHEFPMGHEIPPVAIATMRKFIQKL